MADFLKLELFLRPSLKTRSHDGSVLLTVQRLCGYNSDICCEFEKLKKHGYYAALPVTELKSSHGNNHIYFSQYQQILNAERPLYSNNQQMSRLERASREREILSKPDSQPALTSQKAVRTGPSGQSVNRDELLMLSCISDYYNGASDNSSGSLHDHQSEQRETD